MVHIQRTVLIIDDCLEDRYIYRRYLLQDSNWDYNILEAESGEEALEYCHKSQLDAILLDYLLSDLTGLDLLMQMQIQLHDSVPPVIILTGQGSETIAAQVMKAGAQDYLVKGQMTPADLRFAVDAVIEKAQLQAQLKAAEIERLQRIQRERLVAQIAQQIHRSLNLHEVLQTTVDEVRQFLQTDRVLIFQLSEDQGGRVITESVGPDWLALLSTDFSDPCFAASYIERYQQGRVLAVPDIYDAGLQPCHLELLSRLQVRANLVVPILQEQQLWGLLIAQHCSAPRPWQLLEIDLLKQLATQAGIALRQAELYQQVQAQLNERTLAEATLRYQTDRERFVSQIAQRIRQTLNLAEVLNKTVAEVRHFLRCDRVFIYRFNPDYSGVIEVEAVGENWRSLLAEAVEDTYFTTTQGEDYRQGRIQAIEDVNTAGLTDCHVELLTRFQIRANLAVPILQGDNLWGLLVVNHCSEPRLWQPLEIDLLKQLAIQVGIAIQQSEFHQLVQSELMERQRAEMALQNALQKLNFHVENSPLAVIEWDGDLRVTRWSPEAENIFGWRAEEVLGKQVTDWEFVVTEDAATAQALMPPTLMGSQQVKSCHRNLTKNGSILHCEWYNSTLTDAHGNPVSILSLILNVSERIWLERERDHILQQEKIAREQAETANRVKDEFLAVLSHELRTPLNPILGWSKMLQAGKLDPTRTKAALATIERNAKLQAQLIEDLLDVSRILRGKLTLEVASVNLEVTIIEALETVQLAAEAKQISIQSVFPKTPLFAIGDAGRLQQVVWNLLSNAIKFTPQNGQVEVRLEQIGSLAQFQMIDSGKGIRADFLPHVFDYFRQEDGATTRKFGGLGLGLAIVHQIIELHGGTISVKSQGENQGATFTVRLPLNQPKDSEQGEGNPASTAAVASASLAGLQILVVDDDDDSREFVAFVLQQDGAAVKTVASASDALRILAQLRPDILVSDIGLPQMDGYALMRQVRLWPAEQGGQIPAIALTAYAGDYNQKQAIQAGFQAHLSKPVDPTELVNVVKLLTQPKTSY